MEQMEPAAFDFFVNALLNEIECTEAFENYFKIADSDNDGKISGSEAVVFLEGSGLSWNVICQILGYVDPNKSGILGRSEFFDALRLVTVAQNGCELTSDVANCALYGPAGPGIPPPDMNSMGPTYAESPPQEMKSAGPTSAENLSSKMKSAEPTSALPVIPQPAGYSARYPESHLAETSGEVGMRLIQALGVMLQDGNNLMKIAIEESERCDEVKTNILGACAKVLLSMNHVEAEIYQREKQYKKEIAEIHKREGEMPELVKKEIEELKLEDLKLKNQHDDDLIQLEELNKQKLELETRISDIEKYSCGLKQELDDACELTELLLNQEQSIDSDMSLSSEFNSSELEQATENFSDSLKIGEGGYGCVYKGNLRGTTVAIKKLSSEGLQGLSQFQKEVDILTKVRHPNLVNLIGSCSEIAALVYEHLPNGTLEDRLACANNTPSLTWQARTRIIGEISLALLFLHSCKPHLVIHGDLKPDNILLDTNFTSKLSDFGISRIIMQSDTDITALYRTANPAGTFAYMDPGFFTTGELTPKSDVYSFGIILLCLLTGKVPMNIASVVQEAMQSGRFQIILDESAGIWPLELAEKLAELGLTCADMLRKNRPDMLQVWATIEPLVKVASQLAEASSSGSIFNEENEPSHFKCPISQEIMEDPCIAADGFTYEAEAIKAWLNTGHNTSPMTNLVLPNHDLIRNHDLRSAIQEWQEHHTCL